MIGSPATPDVASGRHHADVVDEMREDAGETLARQWAMLRAIPRAPVKATVTDLATSLADQGFEVSRRTIERDLHTLSARFPLVLDDRAKPYGWSWMKGARFEFMPTLTPSQSVALLLAKTHLQNLLPQNMHKDLMPVFEAAERELASSGWKDWHKRTAVIPSTLALLPPKVSPVILATVQTALARKRCLEGQYRAKGSEKAKRMRIHPLGLLSRGPVLYLVCTLFDYADVRQLALHRLSDVAETEELRREPADFDFISYAHNVASRFHSRGPIRLVALFDEAAAEHLKETLLSEDQTWRPLEGTDKVEVTATVENDEELWWWLLGFGSHLQVMEPESLRAEIKLELAETMQFYQ